MTQIEEKQKEEKISRLGIVVMVMYATSLAALIFSFGIIWCFEESLRAKLIDSVFIITVVFFLSFFGWRELRRKL